MCGSKLLVVRSECILIGEHTVPAKDISSCKWLQRLVNQPLTHLRLVGARRVKPGFGQAVGVVVYPGWARNLVLPTKPFDRGGADGGPPEDIGIRETIPEWGKMLACCKRILLLC